MILKQIQKYSIIEGIMLFLPLLFRLISTPTANLSFFLLAAFATRGRAQAIQALAMSCLFTMINPGIAPIASFGSVGRYAVFLGAFLGVFTRSGIFSGQLKASKFTIATMGLGIFFIIHSLFVSPIPDVSLLKSISWFVVITTLLSAWTGLTYEAQEKLFRQLYLGLLAIMIISLPLLLLPLGYIRTGNGFQGILNHPQAFGPTMSILGAIAASKLLAQKKTTWHYLGVLGISIFYIMVSEARTAGLALVIGLFMSMIAIPVFSGKSIYSALPGLRSQRMWAIASIVLFLSIIFAPQIGGKIDHYISKSGRSESVASIAEAYERSRGMLIDKMVNNINKNPLIGIGFGIASEPSLMVIERDPLLGLPVSAAVEKGVLPLVIVEEFGITGAILVFFWIIWALKKAATSGVICMTLIATVLAINMGESIFFSPGGLGMLTLIIFSWCASNPRTAQSTP